MESDVFVVKTGKATVRIHAGKLTEEERKELWKHATKEYCKAIEIRHPGYFKRGASASQQ